MRLPRKDGLNIIPFIDIMLVLLAIVLSTASFIAQGAIKVNLPESSSVKPQNEARKAQIAIDEANNFFLDNKPMSKPEIESAIMNLPHTTQIELLADSKSHFEAFIEILDILKAKNHENFIIKAKVKG